MELNENYILVLLKDISHLLFSSNLKRTLVFAALIRTITNERMASHVFILLVILLRILKLNENSELTNMKDNDKFT